jgi:hypothetical protein
MPRRATGDGRHPKTFTFPDGEQTFYPSQHGRVALSRNQDRENRRPEAVPGPV